MATTDVQLAKLTIPAEYLEEVRGAVVEEIHDDSDMTRMNQSELASLFNGDDNLECRRVDRDSAVASIRDDLQLLDELLGASGETEVAASPDTLVHVLESMCRLITKRLVDEMVYAPVDMFTVLAMTERLRWATTEALRLFPSEHSVKPIAYGRTGVS